MRVVIEKAQLQMRRACAAAYTSPEWDEKAQALVYPDFDVTLKRLNSTPAGQKHLAWLVKHKLVPTQATATKKKASSP